MVRLAWVGLAFVMTLMVASAGRGVDTKRESPSVESLSDQLDTLSSEVAFLRRMIALLLSREFGVIPPVSGAPEPSPVPPSVRPSDKAKPPKSKPGGNKVSQSAPAQVVKVFSDNCRECHSGSAEKGGGFSLFRKPPESDRLSSLSPFDLMKIDYFVYSGTMPDHPDINLVSGEDYGSLRAWINDHRDSIFAAIEAAESR